MAGAVRGEGEGTGGETGASGRGEAPGRGNRDAAEAGPGGRPDPAGGRGPAAGEWASPEEHHLVVRRSARYHTWGARGPDVRELWTVLHGFRQLAGRFLARFAPVAGPGRLLVAPEALSRFYLDTGPVRHGPESRVGATWMTRDDREREIADYVGYLDDLAEHVGSGVPAAAPRLVLGFSQGLHTAARWVVLGRIPPPRHLVLWGDTLPPDLPMERAAERLAGVVLTLVKGEGDPSRRPDREAGDRALLDQAGIAFREWTHPGGHDLDAGVLERLAEEVGGTALA